MSIRNSSYVGGTSGGGVVSSSDLTDASDLVRKSDAIVSLAATSFSIGGKEPFGLATWVLNNGSTDRTVDGNSTTIDELRNAVFTLVDDLRRMGLVL